VKLLETWLQRMVYLKFCVQANKLHWWSIFREPEHEPVGHIQLYVHYTTAANENNMKVEML
jgi:hypothetical protein